MNRVIVDSIAPVTLVGGGSANRRDLIRAYRQAPRLVAADGGAALILRAGHMPEAVIGDFDSLTPNDAAQIPKNRLHKIAEQDSTDFDKALRHIKAPLVLGVGFLGGRLDHQLGALNVLLRHAGRRCILLGRTDVVFLSPPRLGLDLPEGTPLSLFPMAPVSGQSEGLEWPISRLRFSPDGRVGTSNRVTGPVRLWFDAPGMLVWLPRRVFTPAIRSVLAAPERWPSP